MGFTTLDNILGGGEGNGSGPRKQGDVGSDMQRKMQGTAPKSDKGEGDVTDYSDAIAAAEETDDPDAYKYALAVRIVDNQIGNEQTLGDDEYRAAIDATFDQMNPSVTGSSMRGEDDVLSGAVRTARSVIDDINETAGTGLDWLWDNTAGNLGGLAGVAINGLSSTAGKLFGSDDEFDPEKAFSGGKQTVSDLVTPETGAIASDLLIDLGLSAIPGVGLGLAAGKNAIQQSENIYEALSGRDDITGEEIDVPQRAAKGLMGIGSTALSVVPGLGKAGNAKELAKAGKGMVSEYSGMIDDADDVLKFLDDAESAAASGSVDDILKAASGRSDDAGKEIADLIKEYNGSNGQQTIDSLSKSIEDVANSYRGSMEFQKDVAKSGLESAEQASRLDTPMAAIDSLSNKIKDYPENFKGFMRQAGGDIKGGHPIEAIKDVKNAFMGPVDINDALSRYYGGSIRGNGGSLKDRAADSIRNAGGNILYGTIPSAASNAGISALGSYAELGDDWLEGLANMYGSDDGGVPEGYMPHIMTMMIGRKLGGDRMSSRLPGPNGTIGGGLNVPYTAAQASAYANYLADNPAGVYDEEIDPEVLADLLEKVGDR